MSTPLAHRHTEFRSDAHHALTHLIDAYAGELAARRRLLLDDRAGYRHKLADVAALDPLDFTGLARLYGEHLRHIELLLAELDPPGALPQA